MEEEARLDAQSGGHAPYQLQLRSQVSLYALYTHDNQKKRILMSAIGASMFAALQNSDRRQVIYLCKYKDLMPVPHTPRICAPCVLC